MGNSVAEPQAKAQPQLPIKKENRISLTLLDYKKLETKIPQGRIPEGPLVNISDVENSTATPYMVTILAYIPDNDLSTPDNTSGILLEGNKIYLNYYGVIEVEYVNKSGVTEQLKCRDFRIEYNCEDKASFYDLYYIQFNYQLLEGTVPVDGILVRNQDDDPRTDRGTLTMPAKPR